MDGPCAQGGRKAQRKLANLGAERHTWAQGQRLHVSSPPYPVMVSTQTQDDAKMVTRFPMVLFLWEAVKRDLYFLGIKFTFLR